MIHKNWTYIFITENMFDYLITLIHMESDVLFTNMSYGKKLDRWHM